jgi:hypothetical protein
MLSFWRKTVKTPECWVWIGCVDRDGYGQIGVNYRQVKAHRFSWELHHSTIPEGLCVCHRCDNRSCVNPEHLFLGTNQENTMDKVAKGRQQRGSANGTAKLTEEKVVEIRRLIAAGKPQTHIARQYGVTPGNVCSIHHGRSWGHVK